MTAGSDKNELMRRTLRRYLPDSKSRRVQLGKSDLAAAKEISENISNILSRFSPGTTCALIEEMADFDSLRPELATLVFALKEKDATARVELPVSLVKLLFDVCAGGGRLTMDSNATQLLTNVEKQFLANLAEELVVVFEGPAGPATLQDVLSPGDVPSIASQAMESISISVSTAGCNSMLAVHLPMTQTSLDSAFASVSTLAGSASVLTANPVIRLQLSSMTMANIAKLKQGDIVTVVADQPGLKADLVVRDTKVLVCELGQIGGRYSARVVAPYTATHKRIENNDLINGGF